MAARVRLTAAQLAINQRISQAAVRRANGLEARMRAGLTGGDLRAGSLDASRLADGLSILAAGPVASPPPPTTTPLAPPGRAAVGAVGLSRRQLLVNQRIAQAGVRRANDLSLRLAAGLVTDDFRPGSITAASLEPALRG